MSTEIDESILDLPKIEIKKRRGKKAEKVVKEKKRGDTVHLKIWRDCCHKHAGHKGVLRRYIKDKGTGEVSEGPDYPIYMKAKEEYEELMKKHREEKEHAKKEEPVEIEEEKEVETPQAPVVVEEKKVIVEKKHKK